MGLPVPLEGAAWVEMMDRCGVDRALVAPPGVGADADFKPDLERIARAIKDFPDRLYGYARVKPRRGRVAIEELRRWVEDRGFHAVKLNTLDDDYELSDRALLDPVVQEADRLGVPVFMHTGDSHGQTCTPSMVADIAVDFPDTTFIIGHMGHPGWSDELVPAMKRAPNTVTETAGVFMPSLVQDVVDAVGADRLLMGSNGPYSPVELPPVMIGKHMGRLSDAERQAIMGGNLLRVLGD